MMCCKRSSRRRKLCRSNAAPPSSSALLRSSAGSVGGLSAFFGVATDSDGPDAYPAHTQHDHRSNEPGDDRAADHKPVGERPADAMRRHDPTRAGRKMREDEERGEPIMRHEADVPWVLDQPGWRAGGESPSGVDAKICPCEYEDRVHVAQHVKGEVDA